MIKQSKLTFLVLGAPNTPPYDYSKHFLFAKTAASKGIRTYYYQPNKAGVNSITLLDTNLYLITCTTSYVSAESVGVKSKLQNVYDDFKIFVDTRPKEKIVVIYFESDEYYNKLIKELKKMDFRRILCINVPFLVSANNLMKLRQLKFNDIIYNVTIGSFMIENYPLDTTGKFLLKNLITEIEKHYKKTIVFYLYSNKHYHNIIYDTNENLRILPMLSYEDRIEMINYTNFVIIPEEAILNSSVLNLMFTALWNSKPVFNMSTNWNLNDCDSAENYKLIKLFKELGGINVYNINVDPAIEIADNILDGFELNNQKGFAKKIKKYEVNNLVHESLLIAYAMEESKND